MSFIGNGVGGGGGGRTGRIGEGAGVMLSPFFQLFAVNHYHPIYMYVVWTKGTSTACARSRTCSFVVTYI